MDAPGAGKEPGDGGRRRLTLDAVAVAVVALIAVGLAGAMLADEWIHPGDLWRDAYHDRNSHMLNGMRFALALKTADPGLFLARLYSMQVWGPLHALALGVVLLFGGLDHRLGIVPSLAGWVVTVTFAGVIARRLFADPTQGRFAGALAAVWTAASPAFRLLGSDVMLEGMGAGLSALAIWAYLRARERDQDPARWRWLGVVLTALFFHKANYWGLAAASLALAAILEPPTRLLTLAREARAGVTGVSWRRLLTDPWLIAAAGGAGLVAWVMVRGPTGFVVFGHAVSLYPPETPVTVVYALVFARLALAWRRHRPALRERLGVAGRGLFYWHLLPVAVSFLVPKRLTAFLWFVGPGNQGIGAPHDPLSGASIYWQAYSEGFSPAPWLAVLALVLGAVSLVRLRAYPRGALAVFVFAGLSILGVILHPQHQGRFLASWIFSIWICAGAGGAVLLGWLPGSRTRAAGAALAAGALLCACVIEPVRPAAFTAAIRSTTGPSDLDFVRPYLPALAGSRRVGVAATLGGTQLFAWTLQEHCRCRMDIDTLGPDPGASREQVRDAALAEIAQSGAERWVLVDAPAYPVDHAGLDYRRTIGVVDAMRAQRLYSPRSAYPISSQGAVATLYVRTD